MPHLPQLVLGSSLKICIPVSAIDSSLSDEIAKYQESRFKFRFILNLTYYTLFKGGCF
jgi:hypothetical protein